MTRMQIYAVKKALSFSHGGNYSSLFEITKV